MALPDLPTPTYPLVADPVWRKFGPEPLNYFSGSPLNRVSFLRQNCQWLIKAFAHDDARFVLFKNLGALAKSSTQLHYLRWPDISSLFHSSDVTAAASLLFSEPAETEPANSSNMPYELPCAIFLGLDARVPRTTASVHDVWKGQPLFALDMTPKPPFFDAATKLAQDMEAQSYSFIESRLDLCLESQDAAVFARARHLLNWHARNPFCAGCGSRTISIHGGWKRKCMSGPESSCPTKVSNSVSNVNFPRTDPVVITAVLSYDGSHVLLGRQAKWPKGRYSTLAGFVEPGESVEDAVRREVWEESAVTVGRVCLWGSQPWPFPSNIMLGAICIALKNGDKIDLSLDKELEDARWVPLQDVRDMLAAQDKAPEGEDNATGGRGIGASDGKDAKDKEKMRLPPKTAIANRLLEAVCNRDWKDHTAFLS